MVVNNAGYANLASIEDIDIKGFRAQVDVNLFGGGRIGTPGAAAYQSAKWAVGGFSTVLSKELASFGIKVTVAEPTGIINNMGVTATDNSKVSEPYEQTVGQIIQVI
ncbi:ketoreductase [Fusarium coicis]|nr:ketoreductase [Fusarium coicis]